MSEEVPRAPRTAAWTVPFFFVKPRKENNDVPIQHIQNLTLSF